MDEEEERLWAELLRSLTQGLEEYQQVKEQANAG